MNCVPADSLDSSSSRFVQTLDTEGGYPIKGDTTVLEGIIRFPVCRGERLPTGLTLIATTLSPTGVVEAMPNDGCNVTLFPEGQCRWDNRDSSWLVDLVNARTAGLKLRLKLYHANELRLVHQQLMTGSTPPATRVSWKERRFAWPEPKSSVFSP
jgi:hypothetical protein